MKSNIIDIFGWTGVIAIVGSYGALTFGVFTSGDIAYQLVNLYGALGIIASSYVKHDFQPVALNLVWLCIAIAGIVRAV